MAKCECLLVLVMLLLATTYAWKCLYEEFNLDPEKMKGGWYVYGTYPEKIPMCYFEDLDPYWTRITQTDYSSYAVELHCSLPWMRPQMAIYTRAKRPTADTLREIDAYLQSVQLTRDQFILIRKTRGCKNVKHKPLQSWHLSSYTYLKYHPHNIKPLIKNPNI
ncbi:hypothetical protein KR059_002036 [Drosophila kikkawai]|nr:hypothetical protein KR059_002036 [Drosophila kikkawai]